LADIADVEQALADLISGAVYPGGTSQPSTIVAVDGSHPDCRVFAGWPLPGLLDKDMAAGNPPGTAAVINVSVFAQPGLERNVSRYPREWKDQSTTAPSITAAVSGSTVTIGGTPTIGHYVSIIVFGKTFSYACQAGDTLQGVAAALAFQINGVMPASSSGTTITIPGRSDITARTAAPGTIIRELKRQQRRFQVTVWAPGNARRVATARIVDGALASTDWLTLSSDNTLARLIYDASNDIDRSGKQSVMCRDTFWWVEYATMQVMPGYPITVFGQQFAAQQAGINGPPAGNPYIQNT